MAKNSFLLYYEYIEDFEELTDEQAGKLIKAIYKYEVENEISEDDPIVLAALRPIKRMLDKNKQKSRKGKHHWNWQGGITKENHSIRNSAEYKKFRNEVLKRDNFTCVICGQMGGKLNVHHIVPFSENKQLRLNPNNGITLCVSCHKGVHYER